MGAIMSKIGNFVFEMQEAAQEMSYTDFVTKFGEYFAHVWEEMSEEKLMEIVD